jgi:transposase-like protein
MPKSHAPYPPEYRAEAIRLVRSSGKPVAQIARQLEVCPETLRPWVRPTDIDQPAQAVPAHRTLL